MVTNKGKIERKVLAFALFIFLFFFSISFLSAAFSSTSTSSFSVQYTNPYNSLYSSFVTGPGLVGSGMNTQSGEEFYDFQVYIPPAGCNPYVVRSDLLEEQNVPVFCQLVPLKVNPGLDITRIDRIQFSQQQASQYISGVGFYPAKAAISSISSLSSNPTTGNIGYVVVVLKKQPNEQAMPDSVNATLSAIIEYGGDYAYGIGQTEFYLPMMTDDEFANDYRSYSFFNGVGYVRAQNVQENSATIVVYSSDERILFSDTIEKGKTSRDFYLPTYTYSEGYSYSLGGQGIRISLEDLTIPQAKAKIIVNGETYEVYRNGKFYNNKCTLTSINAEGAGTGNVQVRCDNKIFSLEKKFNDVSVLINGVPSTKTVGQFLSSNDTTNFYLVYAGTIQSTENSYVYIASVDKTEKNQESLVKSIRLAVAGEASNRITESQINELVTKGITVANSKKIGLNVLGLDNNELKQASIKYSGINSVDNPFTNADSEKYYRMALENYDVVASKFATEKNTGPSLGINEKLSYANTNQPYSADALWKEYSLTQFLGQNNKKLEILSRLNNDYPKSVNLINSKSDLAEQLFSDGGSNLLSSDGARDYDAETKLSIELVSVSEPLNQEAGVDLTYTDMRNQEAAVAMSGVGFNETFVSRTNSIKGDLRLTVDSFDENKAFVSYYCKVGNKIYKSSSSLTINNKETKYIDECGTKITVNNINLKKVAKVRLVPIVEGRTRTSNFSFSIGIEKRSETFQLTPEEANDAIEKLNGQISSLRNLTESLGKVVEAGKIACLATSAALNIKNVIAGAGGTATARHDVMTREGGWNDICARAVKDQPEKYSSIDNCISQNQDKIEESVVSAKTAMQVIETKEKGFIEQSTGKNGVNYDATLSLSYTDLSNNIGTYDSVTKELIDGKKVSDIVKNINLTEADIGPTDLRELKYNLEMAKTLPESSELQKSAQQKVYTILKQVEERESVRDYQKAVLTNLGTVLPISFFTNKQSETGDFMDLYWNNGLSAQKIVPSAGVNIAQGSPIALLPSKDTTKKVAYLAVLQKQGDKMYPKLGEIYRLEKNANAEGYIVSKLTEVDTGTSSSPGNNVPTNFVLNVYDSTSLKNTCKYLACGGIVKVFSLEPYKGMPSQMPIDEKEGWYIETKNLISTNADLKSYQDSGKISSFYLCNVGKNKIIEGYGLGDDICMGFNLNTGQTLSTFPGLKTDEARKKVESAVYWITEAQRQLQNNPKTIKINGMTLKVQAVSSNEGTKCTDFMSASDCKLMFNVCDPFVCPNSRCDLGGTYPVDNVIQSGIIGSTVLCLPNFKEGIIVPVCLTGINAGLESWTSILESYRDCLNTSVTTNQTVGICDEIHSVYVCDFFWKQAGPFVSAITKNIFTSYVFGQGPRGGGEYAFTSDAWSNAEKSWQYFTTSYASNSKIGFGFKDLSQIGSEVCKMSMSATYPDSLGEALSPESPIQFNAWFDEMPYTDATIPPTSQYKVYYHIFAGNDQGHYYQVYLKDAAETIGYTGKGYSQLVASGYVAKGQYASETKDYLDVSGYKQLCVRIDNKDECGFKKVSTSFALNYAQDKAVQEQSTERVTTEKACVSGTASVGSLLTPNLQQAATGLVSPELYNYGVVRVCSTADPSSGTAEAGTRWEEVGYCDDANVKCWIDLKSVQNSIRGKGIENSTISEIDSMSGLTDERYYDGIIGEDKIASLISDYISIINKGSKLSELTADEVVSLNKLDSEVEAIYNKLILTTQKVQILFVKSMIYDSASRAMYNVGKPVASVSIESDVPAETETDTSLGVGGTSYNYSPDKIIIQKDGRTLEVFISNSLLKFNGQLIGTLSNEEIVIQEEIELEEKNIVYEDAILLRTLNRASIENNQVVLV